MAKTYVDGREVKHWYLDGVRVKKAFLDGRLVFQEELVVNVTWGDHNFDTGVLHQWMLAAAGGVWPVGAIFRIVVHPGVDLVSVSPANACFWFGGAIVGNTIIIENHGRILGRGARGGNTGPGWQEVGQPAGDAIISDGNIPLLIDNQGVIGGGGGGGGATGWYDGGSGNYNSTGGGGAPFGPGGPDNSGSNYRWWGASATFDTPGAGGSGDGRPAGTGGAWGSNGGDGIYKANGGGQSPVAGGAAGAAIRPINGASCSYINRGDIRGYAP